MRVLVRNLYRAFPELDRYSDEQCERFISAANRGWRRRVLRMVVIVLVFVAAFVPVPIAIAWVFNWLDHHTRLPGMSPAWSMAIFVVMGIPLVAVAPVAAFLTRDRLLRRRVRYVLRTRGKCHSCGYSLIGLPVDEKLRITCPECGFESEVDRSLGELVIDQTGRQRYQPSAASLPKPPRFFTPARTRKLKRISLIIAFFLAVGLPAAWGGYEFWLRHQAELAAKERPGPEGLAAFIAKCQPPDLDPDSPNAWDLFHQAQRMLETTDSRVWRAAFTGPNASSSATYPDFSLVFGRSNTTDPDMIAKNAASAALALQCIDAYRKDGILGKLDEMAACPRAELALTFSPNQPAVMALLPELGQTRNFARMNGARMKLALDAHDLKEFAQATEANFALARICRQQPLLIDQLVAIAIEALTYSRLREALFTHPDAAWLDAIDAAIARQSFSLPRSQFFDGERLGALDSVAWMFSDPDRVRRGQFSPATASMFGGQTKGSLSSYTRNRDELNARFAALSTFVAMDRWQRTMPSPDPVAESDLMLINILMPAMAKCVNSLDQIELDRRGHVVMSALERYYLAHKDYPLSLDELVPQYLKQVPIDPWSGKPLGYIKATPPLPDGRGYLLYSVGIDGVDNKGQADPKLGNHYEVLFGDVKAHTGFDFIINDPDR